MRIENWTVDYGSGPLAITVPHAWRQDVPVSWEGPAVYETVVDPGRGEALPWLVFWGVSYQARVFVDGVEVLCHRGMWDAFSIPLQASRAQRIRVEVVKSGGATFPVREVAGGFVPFVFHTFGGIFREVEVVWADTAPSLLWGEGAGGGAQANEPPLSIESGKLVWRNAPKAEARQQARSQAEEWLARRAGEQLRTPSPLRGEHPSQPAGATPSSPFVGTSHPRAPLEEGRGVDPELFRPSPPSPRKAGRGDSEYFYPRGILNWGWYPDLGHQNPTEEDIHQEIKVAKSLGFNLIKFCLWVPSHRHLELMHESGLLAWIELPLWDPVPDPDRQAEILEEFRLVVRQYRHHPNIAFWTAGCELHETTGAAYRQALVEMIRQEIPGALVKDNSGGSEMYGGDLREYGDFNDFHPYCDTPFYPPVLDSLLNGPRRKMPILLGEFNDIDVHRDLATLRKDLPYWARKDDNINAQGSRWTHLLPEIVQSNRFAIAPDENRHEELMRSSVRKAAFIRRTVQEAVRSRSDISGYVVTGWRDTPISTAGIVDDNLKPRFSKEEMAWNDPACLFLIPNRRPPWVNGGNRPGWQDPFNHFVGRVHWRVGVHSESPLEGELEWDVLNFSWNGDRRPQGRVTQGVGEPVRVEALESTEVGEISWDAEYPGGYLLRVRFGGVTNTWPIWVVPAFESPRLIMVSDGDGWLHGLEGMRSGFPATTVIGDGFEIEFAFGGATQPVPFWRECIQESLHAEYDAALGFHDHWERWLPISPDCVLDREFYEDAHQLSDVQVLHHRIDTRSYEEHALTMVGRSKDKLMLITALRPFGGLGNQPLGIKRNPSGWAWLKNTIGWLTSQS